MGATGRLHQHGHGAVVVSLNIIIKAYRIQDTTYSEVDSNCKIDSFSKLQLLGTLLRRGSQCHEPSIRASNMARSAVQDRRCSLFGASLLSASCEALRKRVTTAGKHQVVGQHMACHVSDWQNKIWCAVPQNLPPFPASLL